MTWQTMIKIFLGIIGIALAVHFGIGKVNQIREDRASKKASEERRQELDQGVLDMIERHNALTDWDKDLFFTSQYQETLLENKGRPIHITGSITDIAKSGDAYKLFMEDHPWSPRIFYELGITDEQYQKLKQIIDDYAERGLPMLVPLMKTISAIVRVEEVSKPLLSIRWDRNSEESFPPRDFLLLVVMGECLELSETSRRGFEHLLELEEEIKKGD